MTAVGLGCGSDETPADTGATSDVALSTADPSSDPSSVASPVVSSGSGAAEPPARSVPDTGDVLAAPAPPDVLVPEDEGIYTLAVGARTALRLDRQREASEPEVEGDAVEVVRVAFESDPGYAQYDVIGRRPGQATVVIDVAGVPYEFTFVVD